MWQDDERAWEDYGTFPVADPEAGKLPQGLITLPHWEGRAIALPLWDSMSQTLHH